MHQLSSLEVWVVLFAAGCALGWIVGTTNGAARRHRALAGDPELDGAFGFETMFSGSPASESQSDKAIEAARVGRVTGLGAHQPPRHADAAAHTPVETRAMLRRQTFAEMPPLPQLRAQTMSARESERVWEAADIPEMLPCTVDTASHDVLRHYRRSLVELERVTKRPSGAEEGLTGPQPLEQASVMLSPAFDPCMAGAADRFRRVIAQSTPRPRYHSDGFQDRSLSGETRSCPQPSLSARV